MSRRNTHKFLFVPRRFTFTLVIGFVCLVVNHKSQKILLSFLNVVIVFHLTDHVLHLCVFFSFFGHCSPLTAQRLVKRILSLS